MNEESAYRVTYDSKANQRHALAYHLSQWWRWLFAWVVFGLIVTGLAGLLLSMGSFIRYPIGKLWQFAAAFGFALVLVALLEYLRKSATAADFLIGKSWTCRLTPEHWVYEGDDGVTTHIPWKIMTIEYESKDAWILSYGASV
ncbi:MAG: hypothetical protein ACAH95_17325 [Fimbriimonas sp.]